RRWFGVRLLGSCSLVPPYVSRDACPTGFVDDFREDVGLAEDFDVVAADFDVGAAVFAVDDLVTDGDGELAALAAIEQLAGADGEDLTALRLFLGRVGQADTAGSALFGFDGFDNDAVIEGTNLDFGHFGGPLIFW